MALDLRDVSRRLFAAADQLWTNTSLRPNQYAQPVLAPIALRQMEAKFVEVDASASVPALMPIAVFIARVGAETGLKPRGRAGPTLAAICYFPLLWRTSSFDFL